MNTTTLDREPTSSAYSNPTGRSALRILRVVVRPQSYRNIGYLLLGLPLGTIWFSVLITALTVGISMVAVALLGIPILLGTWYLTRWFANVERRTANALLGMRLDRAPMGGPERGNLWVRLRSMTRDRNRWRELGYLLWRFPAGIATFTAAVTALAVPFIVAYAPFAARTGDTHPFGTWSESWRIEDAASSSWSWFLIPLGVVLLFAALHLLNVIAKACGRWTAAALGPDCREL